MSAAEVGGALARERLAMLLSIAKEEGRVRTSEAAERCGVSVDTIRRDLLELERRGRLQRVHGGALPTSSLPDSFAERANIGQEVRAAVADAIVSRFEAGQVIGLDGGTTTAEIATRIPPELRVTIVTNNPAAAAALAGHPSVTLVMVGGAVDLSWMAVHGPAAVDVLRSYRFDVSVIGACGVHEEEGVSTNSLAEVETKRAYVERSADVILPATREKIDARATCRVVGLPAVTTLVLEGVDARVARRLERAGPEVVRVPKR